MEAETWAALLATLDYLVLEQVEGRTFRRLGDVPTWLGKIDLDIPLSQEQFVLDSQIPFLENFVVDAADVWASPTGWQSSGPWIEFDNEGRERALEAVAASVDRRRLLLVRFGPAQFRETRRIVQRGRDLSLEYRRLQRWEAELTRRQRELEDLVASRTAELGESKAQLDVELAERRRAQRELHAEEERFRILVEESPLGVLWLQGGRPTYMNPAFSEIFNCRLGEIESGGGPVRQLLGERDESQSEASESSGPVAASVLHRPVVSRIVTAHGVEKRVRSRAVPVARGEEFLLVEDITEQAKIEERLAEAQKMNAIGTLASGIAHDFNNLLQLIQGYAELLMRDRADSDPEAGGFREIIEAATRGRGLSRQLMTMSRGLERRQELVDLDDTVRRVDRIVSRTFPETIEVETILESGPWLIEGDPSQLEQVLLNLAINARDAMPDGGRLTFCTRVTEVPQGAPGASSELPPGEYLELTVADTGTGMDEATQRRMYEPFFTTKEVGRGTGLGLGIVYGVVENHHGAITCNSRPNEGTTFRILLPSVPGEVTIVETEDDSLPGAGERILLIEDDAGLRRLVEEVARRSGYRIDSEPDGESGLERYRREHESIDLVILDLVMPGMGGEKCLQALIEVDPATRVILTSGLADSVASRKLENVSAFVAKPFRIAELLETIRDVLDNG